MLPIANERGNVPDMPGKRDSLDFVLWQPSAPAEPSWPSPWGAGRPGWHIECSAMSTTYLGNRFEIHGGGADLAFPHHESEIAQSEGATGEQPFVSWWMHAGMLRHDGEKMSKSLGNLVLVRDLLGSYTGDAIRHYLVSHHYRDELIFDEAALEQSAQMVARLRQACLVAEEIEPLAGASADPSALDPMVAEHRARFLAAMDDDLDTPAALPELHALAAVCQADADPQLRAQAGWMVRELGARILGLRLATVPSLSRSEPLGAAAVVPAAPERRRRRGWARPATRRRRGWRRRPRPGQRPAGQRRSARGPRGLDAAADLGRGGRHAPGPAGGGAVVRRLAAGSPRHPARQLHPGRGDGRRGSSDRLHAAGRAAGRDRHGGRGTVRGAG
jgi:cysteinyl-tRNA synthetase